MLQGQGSLQAPKGALPRQREMQFYVEQPLQGRICWLRGLESLHRGGLAGAGRRMGTWGCRNPKNEAGHRECHRLAMGPELPLSASERNMQRKEILGLQLQEFELIIHIYSPPWCHFPHTQGPRAALN